jgi:hypothetical protein
MPFFPNPRKLVPTKLNEFTVIKNKRKNLLIEQLVINTEKILLTVPFTFVS